MESERFAIIGLGKFGFYLARTLAESGQQILCVDKEEALVEAISSYVTDAVVADASRREVLENLGIHEMEKVIVAVGSLTQSVLITLFLKELSTPFILAKANDEDHAKVLTLVGANEVIIPERNSANKVAQNLTMPNVVDFIPMMPEFCIAEITPPDNFIGYNLAELNLRKKYHMYVIGIRKKKSSHVDLMPPAEHIIKKDELLYVLSRKDDLKKLSRLSMENIKFPKKIPL